MQRPSLLAVTLVAGDGAAPVKMDRAAGWMMSGSWQPHYFSWGRMTPRKTCLGSLYLVPTSHQTQLVLRFSRQKKLTSSKRKIEQFPKHRRRER